MKLMKIFGVGLLALSLLAPPAQAQRWRRHRSGLGAALAIGAIGAIAASSNRGYYGYGGYGYGYPYGYSSYGYPSYSYYRPYSYTRPVYTYRTYGAPVYAAGGPMIAGAVTYTDEGDYRNYRDAYGNYLGRVFLGDIPPGRW